MPVATFDTLKFANTLKAAGVPDKQAEAQAVAFAEVIQTNLHDLVTKDDLSTDSDTTRKDTKQQIDDLRKDTKQQIDDLRKDFRHELKEVEQRLIARIDTVDARIRGEMTLLKWMFGAMMTVNLGILIRLFVYRGTL